MHIQTRALSPGRGDTEGEANRSNAPGTPEHTI
jgi:hypothetical protein